MSFWAERNDDKYVSNKPILWPSLACLMAGSSGLYRHPPQSSLTSCQMSSMGTPHLSPLASLGLLCNGFFPAGYCLTSSLEADMAKSIWMSGGSLLYWADFTGPPAVLSWHQKAEFLSNKSPCLLLKTYLFIHYFLIQTFTQQIFL